MILATLEFLTLRALVKTVHPITRVGVPPSYHESVQRRRAIFAFRSFLGGLGMHQLRGKRSGKPSKGVLFAESREHGRFGMTSREQVGEALVT